MVKEETISILRAREENETSRGHEGRHQSLSTADSSCIDMMGSITNRDPSTESLSKPYPKCRGKETAGLQE